MKRVSVVTTYYNAEKYLLNAVNSVIVQQVDNDFEIEYVLVNDVTPDNSEKMLKDFLQQMEAGHHYDPKRILIRMYTPDHNLGCGGSRKYGIEKATGDYIMFLDADDYYISANFIQRAFHKIVDTKSDIVEYGLVYNQPNGQQIPATIPEEITIENNPVKALEACFKDNIIKFNVWTKIYTKEIIATRSYSDSRTFEDVRTVPYWLYNSKKITVCPGAEVNYRAAGGSIIREDNIKTRLGTISAIASLFEDFKEYPNVLKAMYGRAMVDLEAVLFNHSSENAGFNEMSRLNTQMLKYIYPDKWQDLTYHIEDDIEYQQSQQK